MLVCLTSQPYFDSNHLEENHLLHPRQIWSDAGIYILLLISSIRFHKSRTYYYPPSSSSTSECPYRRLGFGGPVHERSTCKISRGRDQFSKKTTTCENSLRERRGENRTSPVRVRGPHLLVERDNPVTMRSIHGVRQRQCFSLGSSPCLARMDLPISRFDIRRRREVQIRLVDEKVH